MPFGSSWVPARAPPVRAAAGVVRPPRPEVAAAPASAAVLRKVLRSFFMISSRRGRTTAPAFRAGELGRASGLVAGLGARAVVRAVRGCRAGSGACGPPAAPVCYRARKPHLSESVHERPDPPLRSFADEVRHRPAGPPQG